MKIRFNMIIYALELSYINEVKLGDKLWIQYIMQDGLQRMWN